MKIKKSRAYVEVKTSDQIYVYFVSPLLCRIDAIDFALERHKDLHPDKSVLSLRYSQKVDYIL